MKLLLLLFVSISLSACMQKEFTIMNHGYSKVTNVNLVDITRNSGKYGFNIAEREDRINNLFIDNSIGDQYKPISINYHDDSSLKDAKFYDLHGRTSLRIEKLNDNEYLVVIFNTDTKEDLEKHIFNLKSHEK